MTIFVSSNKGKITEMRSILGDSLKTASMDLVEIQSTDYEEIVRHKLLQAFAHFGEPVLVEDTGLQIDTYGKSLPGPFIKFFLDSMTLEQICNQARGSLAKITTMVGHYYGAKFIFAKGETHGMILSSPRGDGGFGFDPIFVPEGSNLTLAEMDGDQKNKVSSRGRALTVIKKLL